MHLLCGAKSNQFSVENGIFAADSKSVLNRISVLDGEWLSVSAPSGSAGNNDTVRFSDYQKHISAGIYQTVLSGLQPGNEYALLIFPQKYTVSYCINGKPMFPPVTEPAIECDAVPSIPLVAADDITPAVLPGVSEDALSGIPPGVPEDALSGIPPGVPEDALPDIPPCTADSDRKYDLYPSAVVRIFTAESDTAVLTMTVSGTTGFHGVFRLPEFAQPGILCPYYFSIFSLEIIVLAHIAVLMVLFVFVSLLFRCRIMLTMTIVLAAVFCMFATDTSNLVFFRLFSGLPGYIAGKLPYIGIQLYVCAIGEKVRICEHSEHDVPPAVLQTYRILRRFNLIVCVLLIVLPTRHDRVFQHLTEISAAVTVLFLLTRIIASFRYGTILPFFLPLFVCLTGYLCTCIVHNADIMPNSPCCTFFARKYRTAESALHLLPFCLVLLMHFTGTVIYTGKLIAFSCARKQQHSGRQRRAELQRKNSISFLSQYHFSKREKEVFALLLNMMTYKEIALTLHISENTVKKHIASGLKKAGILSVLEFVAEYRHQKTI